MSKLTTCIGTFLQHDSLSKYSFQKSEASNPIFFAIIGVKRCTTSICRTTWFMLRDFIPATTDRAVERNNELPFLLCPYNLSLLNPQSFSAMCSEVSSVIKTCMTGMIFGDFFPLLTNRLIAYDEFSRFFLGPFC